ncbi:hypothetical protein FDW83_18060 [Pseudarthrobacter sp. NamE2]|uniref:hypothetical protein n=1 Tax=Pseudarthrobacter sp. NamE2 TaxID=2576838 RepID=UPI0010FEE1AB|nr:hypothetical protein [Pseudarthrobacter sp. NamE2]TLM80977.1 hypothetical protein FDW83_18060 [Pseudarthrobacter sp. NamE2]
MSNNTPATIKSAIEAAKNLKETLESLGANGAAVTEPQSGSDTPRPTEAADIAARARKNYDGLIRWILGVFAAIGLLIFGSVPFADLENVDMRDGAGLGLFIAGVGLIVVVYAATSGFELQDASLGELKSTLGDPPKPASTDAAGQPVLQADAAGQPVLQADAAGQPVLQADAAGQPVLQADAAGQPVSQADAKKGTANSATEKGPYSNGPNAPRWWRWLWIAAPRRASHELWETLYGPESEAHLGPGVTSVSGLISKIGQLEKEVMADETGGNESSIALKAIGDQARVELQVAEKALAELRRQQDDASEERKPQISAEIRAQEERYRGLVDLLPTSAVVKKAGQTAVKLRERERYLWHRRLLLEESAVAQLRGTFRLVRGWLAIGAGLILVGGVLYAYAVSNPEDKGLNSHVLVNVPQGTEAWKALEKCRSDEGDIVGMDALLLSSDDADGLQNGPFTFVAIPGTCAGTKVEIGEGGGAYQLAPTSSAEKAAAGGESAESPLVTVTIKANSPAWRAAVGCRPEDSTDDLTGLVALLRSSSDGDARTDGPFAIETADRRCAGLDLNVGDGDGTYSRQ